MTTPAAAIDTHRNICAASYTRPHSIPTHHNHNPEAHFAAAPHSPFPSHRFTVLNHPSLKASPSSPPINPRNFVPLPSQRAPPSPTTPPPIRAFSFPGPIPHPAAALPPPLPPRTGPVAPNNTAAPSRALLVRSRVPVIVADVWPVGDCDDTPAGRNKLALSLFPLHSATPL